MSKIIKPSNRYTISGFMTHPDLGIKGVELKVYAIINGLSQGPKQYFTGSIDYLMELSGASKNSVLNALQNLEAKKLIAKYLTEDCKIVYKAASIEIRDSERKVKDHHYFTVWGWMVAKEGLALKDLELNVYALVYMLSQGEGQYCTASTKYLGEFTGCTDRAVRKVLVKLWEKGLLKRIAIGVNRYMYKAIIPKCVQQSEQASQRVPKSSAESKSSAPVPKSSAPVPKSSDVYNKAYKQPINKCLNGSKKFEFKNFEQRDNQDFDVILEKMLS